jgi:membrane protein DedA with SNARE-associated domain/rhodanese-related sulfurtransferase
MHQIASLIEQFGLLIVFLNVLLEQGGLPLPSWPMLIVAGALAFSGAGLIPPLLAAAAASIIADAAWYMAGARWGRRVLAIICRVSLSPDSCIRQTENVFTRIGPKALLFVKFLPGLGLVTVTMAGITGVGMPLFLLLDAIGAAAFAAVPIVLGRIFHNAVDALLVTLAQLGEYSAILLAAALALYICVRWTKRQVFARRLRMDRITVAELAQMIDGGEKPVIFDIRPADMRLRDGIIPGARVAHPSDIETALKEFPRDAEIVVYCSCPNEASAALAAQHLKRAGFKTIRPLLGGIEAWEKAGYPVAIAA